jgi:putative DNA primase/helicase
VNNTDDAVWNRLRELPFTHQHVENRDSKIKSHLLRSAKARAAVLAWLIDGLQAYLSEGLKPPDTVLKVTEEYRAQMNPLSDWADECCVFGEEEREDSRRLRRSYERFAGNHALGEKRVAKAISQLPGVMPYRTKAERGYRGIQLLAHGEFENED